MLFFVVLLLFFLFVLLLFLFCFVCFFVVGFLFFVFVFCCCCFFVLFFVVVVFLFNFVFIEIPSKILSTFTLQKYRKNPQIYSQVKSRQFEEKCEEKKNGSFLYILK